VTKTESSSSHIILDQQIFQDNLDVIKKSLNTGVKLSAVIKGNAYGHGISTFVPLAENAGINHFAVYGIEEARAFASAAREGSALMIMGYISQDDLTWVLQEGYEFYIYDLQQLNHALRIAQEVGRKAQIHVEMETGMNRTGIDETDFEKLCEILSVNGHLLTLCGVCTHFAGAESLSNRERILSQAHRFEEYLKLFEKKNVHFERKHAACSAAALRYPEFQYDMVRIGILLYGFWPNQETLGAYLSETRETHDPLTSILSWKSQVMTIKQVKAGEYIGYGTSYLANQTTRIAIIPVGYAHGYARSLSNQGRVLINGHRVPVVGIVNMNMMAADITNIGEVERGDEVVLIGFQKESRITVASFGEMSSQMNYELLARLPHNIPRKILQ